MRKYHRIFSGFIAAMLVFYAVTGILLNHRKDFNYFQRKEISKFTVDAVDTSGLNEVIERLKTKIDEKKPPTVIKIKKDGKIEFLYGSHGVITYIFNLKTGEVTKVKKIKIQPATFFNNLHKSFKTSKFWIYFVDLVSFIIILSVFTGLFINFRKNIIYFVAGIILFVVAAIFYK